ncbi:MAG: class I SAM-dependent methyltransferase [Polyangiaceae bacterium]
MQQYNKLSTEFYDLDKPDEPADAFQFYLKYAEEAQGPILEPMSGSGRFLLPLLARGFDVDGVDASPFMLEACRQRAAQLRLTPTLLVQNLEGLQLERRYALAFIPAGSFGLLTQDAQAREALRRLHAALLPGGKLVLEVDRPAFETSTSWPWGGRWLKRPDGAMIVLSWLGQYAASERTSYSVHRYELVIEGRVVETEMEEFNLRAYEQQEFQTLLESAGFVDVKALKAFEQRAPDTDDEGLVFECRRP